MMKWHALNPDFDIRVFNDFDLEEFFEKYLGDDSDAKSMIQSFPIGGMKGDYWRYYMLYKIGGIYIDIDMLPFKPISEWPNYPWVGFNTLIAPEHTYPD